MFNKMLAAGKVNRQFLIQKLIGEGVANISNIIPEVSDISSRSINGPHEEDIMNENLIEDTSRDSNSRIAMEEQRHRHKISNTNSNFYKFRQPRGEQM